MKVDGTIEKFYQYSFPMQTVLVTCNDEHGKTNVITIAWHTPISKKPPLYGISLAPSRYSHDLIKKNKEFVVNFVHYKMVEKAHFCSQNHLEETRKFLKYAETHVWHFISGLIILPVVGMLITFMILENVGLFIIFGGFGLVIIIFPFATPQTNNLLGIKNSILLVRIIGVILVVAGIFLLLL